MTKAEAFIAKLEAIKTPENAAIIEGIEKGFNIILEESRRRTRGKALTESVMANYDRKVSRAKGFASLDMYRKQSGMDNKTFVESVGHTILESMLDDGIKDKLLGKLGEYSKTLTENADDYKVFAAKCALGPLDDEAKGLIVKNDIDGLRNRILPETDIAYRWEAQAKMEEIDDIIRNGSGELNGMKFKLGRALINTPEEKLLLLIPENTAGTPVMPYYVYGAYVKHNAESAPDTYLENLVQDYLSYCEDTAYYDLGEKPMVAFDDMVAWLDGQGVDRSQLDMVELKNTFDKALAKDGNDYKFRHMVNLQDAQA